MNAPEVKAVLGMTSDTIGKDLLSAVVQEIKMLPDVWAKIAKAKQDDVIDRLRNRVETNVKMAVHLISAEGRTVVAGDLDQITIKDGVKAVVKFGSSAPNLHELYEASGKAVLVVVANPAQHTGGMDEIKGESDQRAMDLGHEYDPNGDGYKAASEGKPQSECPVMKDELCLQWIAGWEAWQEENNTEWWQAHGDNDDDLGGEAA
jgi:ribosome modulation factor